MNKTLLNSLALLLFLTPLLLDAQTPNYHWATKFDSEYADNFGLDADDQFVVDPTGNTYLLKRIVDQIQYGDTTLFADPEAGAYALAKYNAVGQFQWARIIVGLDEDGVETRWGYLNSVSIAATGNVILCGEFDSYQLFAGTGDPVQNQCPDSYCNTLFLATFNPSGQLLGVEQNYGYGYLQTDADFEGSDSPVLAIDGRGQRHLVFNVSADTLMLGGQKQSIATEGYHILLAHSNAQNRLEKLGAININNGGFLPLKLVPLEDGSVLLFGETDPETTFSDAYGFSYTTGVDTNEYSLEDIYLVIKYNAQGHLQWISELQGEYAEAQLVADPQGHTYLMGYFETFLKWKQKTLIEGEEEYGGFLFRLDEQGDIVWKKIYPNANIDVSLSSQVACITPDGGLLAPLVIVAAEGETVTEFEARTVKSVWYEYTSAIGHYNLNGVLDTFVTLPAVGEGIFFVTDLRYDLNGRLYGLFQTAEIDTLLIGNYAFPVAEFTSQILACFTLSNLPPGLTTPKATINVEKNAKNLRMTRTYPNPTDGQLTVEWEPQTAAVELVLSDVQGKLLQTFQLEPYAQQQILGLDQWPAGWYTLEWRCGVNW